jgi:hypothetical protein
MADYPPARSLGASLALFLMSHTSELKPRSQHAARWIFVFAAVSATAWILIDNRWNLHDNPIASRIALGYFFVMSAGPYWMLYDSWQHERKLTRKMWLFFIPGGFLWYYFEVYRPRSAARKGRAQDNRR